MRIFVLTSFLLLCWDMSIAQTRYYVMFGSNFSTSYATEPFYQAGQGTQVYQTDNDYKTKQIGKYLTADFVIEKRINNTIYGVTGLSMLRAGYKNKSGTNFSQLDCTYLAVPLMIRANFINGFLLDVGPLFRMPIQADLTETALKDSQYERSEQGSVLPYLSKVSLGATMQLSVVLNRYVLSGFIVFGKHSVDETIEDEWGLGGGYRYYSLFLRDFQPRFSYTLTGIKIGMRL
jgi:hypothetical protein